MKEYIKLFVVPAVLSFILVPLVKQIGWKLEVYAQENSRTVHHGKIVRIGGVAIFLAFNIAMALTFKADRTINGILCGGIVIFATGLIDDMIDMRPKLKLLCQCIAALIAILVGGISLDVIYLPLGITIDFGVLSFIITFFWIVGVTNAINLIDGLDGLSSGICMIVLTTVSILAFMMKREDVFTMCVLLVGSIAGFWYFNFHPASIFMGDCGALYLGYMLACLSLLGFKTATVITLGFPILVLFVPISDTLLAIVRRKLKGESFDTADKEHMHHILMFKLHLGHKNAVLTLYAVTAAFSLTALAFYYSHKIGALLLLILLIIFDLFIEYTGMLNPKYRPLLKLIDKLTETK